MENRWGVLSNYVCGEKVYAVARRLRMTEPFHSGNLEYASAWLPDREEAEQLAEKLNCGALEWRTQQC